MTFKEKLSSKIFWSSVIRVFIVFLFTLTIISLLFNNFNDIFTANWTKINEDNFANQKWIRFYGIKVTFAFLYALYTVNKRIK